MYVSTLSALALALPLAAAAHGGHHHAKGAQGACPSPALPFSTYCCHGSLLGPSVPPIGSASGSASASATDSASASDSGAASGSATGGLSGTLSNVLPSSITAHVPIPIHTNSDTPPLMARVDPESSVLGGDQGTATKDSPKTKTDDSSRTTLASGVVCQGSVETLGATMGSNGTTQAGAGTTTKVVGITAQTSAPASTTAATTSAASSGAAVPGMGEVRWAAMMGAGAGVGLGMVML